MDVASRGAFAIRIALLQPLNQIPGFTGVRRHFMTRRPDMSAVPYFVSIAAWSLIASLEPPAVPPFVEARCEVSQLQGLGDLEEAIGEKFPFLGVVRFPRKFGGEVFEDRGDEPLFIGVGESEFQQRVDQGVFGGVQVPWNGVGRLDQSAALPSSQ